MGDKRTRKGLDSLRNDIQGLTEVIADLRDTVATQQALASIQNQHGSGVAPNRVSGAARELEAQARATDDSGGISLYGFFAANGNSEEKLTYRWSLEDRSVSAVLNGPIPQYAHMLAAIGHPQRLNILLMLLAEPSTANDVVTQLSLGTTGAAYHHLNVLQAAGFVEQHQRGIFTIVANRIPTLLTILASLANDMAVEISSDEDDSEDETELALEEEMYEDDDEEDDIASGPAA